MELPILQKRKILTTATAGEKLHPNVVAVLFVTVLTCCC